MAFSTTPPLFLIGVSFDLNVGFAQAFGKRYGNRPAGFLIYPVWTIERPIVADEIAEDFARHRAEYPAHLIRYICNTPKEAELLQARHVPAIYLNHKFIVSERIFRPLPGASATFDAIYNARFVSMKRHELAARVGSVAYVTYTEGPEAQKNDFRRLWAETAARSPSHALLNNLVDGLPVRLSQAEVNAALNRAETGLILSAVEGASYATVEYLLAGLPVVSTPSVGGRDVFFDPEDCIVCDPDPDAVRDAVGTLKARKLPRGQVRARILTRLEADRRRFLMQLDDMLRLLGEPPRFSTNWPPMERSGIVWASFDHHLRRFDEMSVAASAG